MKTRTQTDSVKTSAKTKSNQKPSTQVGGGTSQDARSPQIRDEQIRIAAYLLAEKRGFTPGEEIQDWISAEAIVDSKLTKTH